jgi:hypothetical protein
MRGIDETQKQKWAKLKPCYQAKAIHDEKMSKPKPAISQLQ